jgi:hypothetical protein
VRYKTVNSPSVPKIYVTMRYVRSEGRIPHIKFGSNWRYQLHFYSLNARKIAHCAHGIGGSMGLRTSKDAEEEIKYCVPTVSSQSLIFPQETTIG